MSDDEDDTDVKDDSTIKALDAELQFIRSTSSTVERASENNRRNIQIIKELDAKVDETINNVSLQRTRKPNQNVSFSNPQLNRTDLNISTLEQAVQIERHNVSLCKEQTKRAKEISAAASAANIALRCDNSQLQSQIDRLISRDKQLQLKVDYWQQRARGAFQQRREAFDDLKREFDAKSREIDDMKAQCAGQLNIMHTELKKARESIVDILTKYNAAQSVQTTNEISPNTEVIHLEGKIVDLEQRIVVQDEEYRKLQSRAKELEDSLFRLSKLALDQDLSINHISQSPTKVIRTTIVQKFAENKNLSQRLAALQEEHDQLVQQSDLTKEKTDRIIKDLRSTNATLKSELTQVESQMHTDSQAKISSLDEKIVSLSAQLKTMKQQWDECNAELSDVKSQLLLSESDAKYNRENAVEFEKKMKDTSKLYDTAKSKIESLEAHIIELKRQLIDDDAKLSTMKDYQVKSFELENSLGIANQKIQTLEMEMTMINNALTGKDKSCADHCQKLQRLELDNDKQQKQIISLKENNQILSDKLEKSKVEAQRINSSFGHNAETLQETREKLSHAQTESERLKRENQNLKAESVKLKEDCVNEVSKNEAMVADLWSKYRDLEFKRTSLESQLNEQKEDIEKKDYLVKLRDDKILLLERDINKLHQLRKRVKFSLYSDVTMQNPSMTLDSTNMHLSLLDESELDKPDGVSILDPTDGDNAEMQMIVKDIIHLKERLHETQRQLAETTNRAGAETVTITERLEKQINELEKAIDQLRQTNNHLDTELNSKRMLLITNESDHNALKILQAKTLRDKQSIELQFRQKNESCKQLQEQLANAHKERDEFQHQLRKLQLNEEHWYVEKIQMGTEKTSMQDQIAELKTKRNLDEKKIANLEHQIAENERKFEETITELDVAKGRISTLKGQVEHVKGTTHAIESDNSFELNSLKSQLKQSRDECLVAIQKSRQLENELKNQREQLWEQEQRRNGLEEQLQQNKRQQSQLTDDLFEVKKKLAITEEREMIVRDQLKQRETPMQQEQVFKYDQLIDKLQNEIKELNETILAMKLEKSKLTGALKRQNASDRNWQQTLKDLQRERKELEKRLTKMEEDNIELTKQISDLTKQVSDKALEHVQQLLDVSQQQMNMTSSEEEKINKIQQENSNQRMQLAAAKDRERELRDDLMNMTRRLERVPIVIRDYVHDIGCNHTNITHLIHQLGLSTSALDHSVLKPYSQLDEMPSPILLPSMTSTPNRKLRNRNESLLKTPTPLPLSTTQQQSNIDQTLYMTPNTSIIKNDENVTPP